MIHKLVCFDLDGTIIDNVVSVWETLHDRLQTDEHRREDALARFRAGELSYDEWAEHDVGLWKEIGATKEVLMKALGHLKLMKGAKETLLELRKRKIKAALISGSLNIVLEKVLPEYIELFDYVFINKILFDSDGRIIGQESSEFDNEGKEKAMRIICAKEGLKPAECVFVGDEDNDIHIARAAGLSIAFNSGSERLRSICDAVIDEKDLRLILEHIQ
ncbi:MAG: HAD family phosphatase [archaeon]